MKRIFMLCPDMPVHSGGVSVIYDHVIALNKMGFNASIVHFSSNFKKINWKKFGKDIAFLKFHYIDKMFEVVQAQKDQMKIQKCLFNFTTEDIFVIPEGFPNILAEFSQNQKLPCKFTMFTQGWLYIIPALQQVFQGNIPNVKQIGCNNTICVSKATATYVQDMFKFTDEEIKIVPNWIDSKIFNLDFGTEEIEEVIENEDGELDIAKRIITKQKKDQICFMPRKGMEKWYGIILSLFQLTNTGKPWNFIPIVDKTQEQVAQIMKESKIFLNFTEGEGFGLPALEAIMCGCLYVGNAGFGGREFLDGNAMSFHDHINDCNDPYQWLLAIKSAINWTESESYIKLMNEEFNELSEKYSEANFLKGLKNAYTV